MLVLLPLGWVYLEEMGCLCRVGIEGRREREGERGKEREKEKERRGEEREKWGEKCRTASAWVPRAGDQCPRKGQPAPAPGPCALRVTPHQGASVLTLSPCTTLRSIASL